MANKQGFTLIELLVVVLIIGILAAMALPQYKKAVLKTHYGNIKAMALAYVKAANIYYLANNTWPTKFEELDVDLPAGSQIKNPISSNCGTSGKIYCCLQAAKTGYQSTGITCGKTDYTIGFQYRVEPNDQVCSALQSNAAAVSICKAECRGTTPANLPTPDGHQQGYYSCYY